MNDYIKFKNLLAWFVHQLNVNNGITDGDKVTGHGYYDNSSLRKYYADCRNYTDFDLDCTINHQYGNNATTSNYINLAGTRLNIIPEFDTVSKEVICLYIGNHPPQKPIDRKSESVSVASLDLDDADPNQAIRDFFDMFKQQILVYKNNLATSVVDEKEQRAAFKQWYSNNIGSKNSAATISTAIGKARLKDGRAVFSVANYDELNSKFCAEGLDGYFEARDGDYSKMDAVFDIESNTQRDDLKNGIKFYLHFLNEINESDFLTPTNQSYWLAGAAYGDRANDQSQLFIEKGIYAIGFNKTDISDIVSNPSDFTDWVNNISDNRAQKAFELLSQMKTGDKIAIKAAWAKHKTSMLRIKAIGTILESLENGYSFDEDLGHTIPVEWTPITPVDYELGGYRWTIHHVTKREDIETFFYATIRQEPHEALTEKGISSLPPLPLSNYNKNNFLDEVFFDDDRYDDIVALLKRKMNIILKGAPGVGKSYMAKRLAYSVVGAKDERKVEMVQFHQSYSYEDFIEGFRPNVEKNGKFDLMDGIFKKFCNLAKQDLDSDYFFIIDEINRGNLSKIMGELMSLLENDKRGEAFAMKLTYSGEKFFVPENVYVIGMMNTADRSLAMIDYALRRRFSFIPIEPLFDHHKFIAAFKKNYPEAESIISKMKELNKFIINNLDRGHQIGHSYFCSDKIFSQKDIDGIIKYEIMELLNEYFFDDEDALNKARSFIH